MTLTYRGQAYNPFNTSVETLDTEMKATYRGAAYSLQRTASLRNHPTVNLTYRSVAYGYGTEIDALVASNLASVFG